MSQLGLQLVQAAAGVILNIQESSEQQQDKLLVEWQLHFSRQFNNFFNRVGQFRNYKVQAEFFEALMPVQQLGRSVPINL